MASKETIKQTVYDDLVAAVTNSYTVHGDSFTVTEDDVSLINPDGFERLPAVAYDYSFTRRSVNGVGNGPDNVKLDQNGDIETEQYREYITGLFTVYVAGSYDAEMEALYEDAHREFGKYDTSMARTWDFHSDVDRILVTEASSSDFAEEDAPIRMDTFTVSIDFYRNYEETGDVIREVDGDVDAGGSNYEDNLTT